MGIISTVGAFSIAVLALQAPPPAEETLAEPLNRRAPGYPVSCRPAPGESAEPQQVTVTFEVTRDGATEGVRVRETSDPCFDETAIAAARSWKYKPRRVNGVKQRQSDVEVTLTFVWNGETQTQEYDARPISRVPPRYPERCGHRAGTREKVLLEFDVTEEGRTENIRIVESSKTCFERASIIAVSRWRYQPRLVNGVATRRNNVQTQITYEVASSRSRDAKFRREVKKRLGRVERSLRKTNTDPLEVLAELEAIETDYGDEFSRPEMRSFYQLRAAARIEAGDYEGALDDLRIVRQSGLHPEAAKAVADTIQQLEAAIAAQEAAAAADKNVSEQNGQSEEIETPQ